MNNICIYTFITGLILFAILYYTQLDTSTFCALWIMTQFAATVIETVYDYRAAKAERKEK